MIINENFFDDITDVDVVSDSLPVETSIEQTRTNCLIYAVFLLRNDIIIDSPAESRKDIESKTKSVLDKYEKMLSQIIEANGGTVEKFVYKLGDVVQNKQEPIRVLHIAGRDILCPESKNRIFTIDCWCMFNYNYNEVNPYYINNMLNLFLNKMSMFCNNTTYTVIDESKTQNRMIYSDSKIFTEDMLDSEMTDTLNENKFYTIDYLFSYKLMHNRESYELKLYKDIVEMLSDKRQFTYREYLLINDYYTDFNDSDRYRKYFPRNEHHVYVGQFSDYPDYSMVWRDYNELVLYTIDGEYQVNNRKRKGAITISGNKLLGYLQSEKKLDMLFKQNKGFKAFISVNDTYNTMTMTLIMNGTFNPGDFGEKIDDVWTNEVIAVLKTDFSRMTYTNGRKISKATWKKYVTEHKDDTDINCRDFLLTLAALIGYDDSGYNKMCSLLYADLG